MAIMTRMTRISIRDDFKTDYITRVAGERLRTLILTSYQRQEPLEIDFTGLTVGSTSFFDEAFAKLADEGWDQKTFEKNVVVKGIHPMDLVVMKQVCKYRGLYRS